MTIEIKEEERQVLLLALAILCFQRPGWELFIETIVEKLDGKNMFEQFLKQQREDD